MEEKPRRSLDNPILVDPEIMQGTACFAGTRVPVTSLFDYLEDGLAKFLADFPSVQREQAAAVLAIARAVVPRTARASRDDRQELFKRLETREPGFLHGSAADMIRTVRGCPDPIRNDAEHERALGIVDALMRRHWSEPADAIDDAVDLLAAMIQRYEEAVFDLPGSERKAVELPCRSSGPGSLCANCIGLGRQCSGSMAPETLRLSPEEQQRFAEALINPPEPHDALRRAFECAHELFGDEHEGRPGFVLEFCWVGPDEMVRLTDDCQRQAEARRKFVVEMGGEPVTQAELDAVRDELK